MHPKRFKFIAPLVCFYVFISLYSYGQVPRCSTKEIEEDIILSDPSYLSRRDQVEIQVQSYLQSAFFSSYENAPRSVEEAIIKIPVVFHLIGNDIITQITMLKVQEQIQIMNNDFRKITGTNGFGNGVDTKIQFCIASLGPSGNATNGRIEVAGVYGAFGHNAVDDVNLKSLSHWPPSSYLNIWICNVTPGLLAWGTFPSMYLGTQNEFQDGVVCGVNYFGLNAGEPNYGSGRTLTHEIGHWLDLRHVWGDEADCTGSDGINDTPFCSDQYYSNNAAGCTKPIQCTIENNAAGLTDLRQIENYMDYSDDLCMNMFSNGQKDKMWGTLNTIRNSLFTSIGGCNSNCIDGIKNGNETGIDCGGNCPPCTNPGGGYPSSCKVITYQINNENTNTANIINVCKDNIIITPYNYTPCTSGPEWLYTDVHTRTNHIPCFLSGTPTGTPDLCYTDLTPWGLLGVPDNSCVCWYRKLFLAFQECDENKNLIGTEYNYWFDFQTGFSSFSLNSYLPPGALIQEGKYYKIKIASTAGGVWREHSSFIRVYTDNLLIQNKTITHDQFAVNITIENSTVPSSENIKVVAKTQIEILSNSSLKNGSYYIDYFDCNSLDQFRMLTDNNVAPTASSNTYNASTNNLSPSISAQKNSSSNILNVKKLENKSESIKVYPNPATNEINIDFEIETNQTISSDIFSINSHLVGNIANCKIFEKGFNIIKFNCSEIPNGVYIVKIQIDNETITKKVVILHL